MGAAYVGRNMLPSPFAAEKKVILARSLGRGCRGIRGNVSKAVCFGLEGQLLNSETRLKLCSRALVLSQTTVVRPMDRGSLSA